MILMDAMLSGFSSFKVSSFEGQPLCKRRSIGKKDRVTGLTC